jgi:hypothetical protein
MSSRLASISSLSSSLADCEAAAKKAVPLPTVPAQCVGGRLLQTSFSLRGTSRSVISQQALDVVPKLARIVCRLLATPHLSRFRDDTEARHGGFVRRRSGDELFAGYSRYQLTRRFWRTLTRVSSSRTVRWSRIRQCHSIKSIDRLIDFIHLLAKPAKRLRPLQNGAGRIVID